MAAPVGHESVRRTFLEAASIACTRCLGTDLRVSSGQETIDGGIPALWRYRVQGGYKLLAVRNQPAQLFDVDADPTDRTDLASRLPALLTSLGEGLHVQTATQGTNVDELRALGYVGL